MNIDIHTLVIIIGLTHLMQVLVFFHQYKVNKSFNGPGWWLLWSAAEVFGFGAMLLRNIPSLLPMIIIIQNSMIVAGTVFLYVGVRRFLNKPVNLKLILPAVSVFLAGLLWFLFIDNEIQIRSAIISATLAVISFFTAQSLLADKTRSIKASARFNAVIFLIHSGIFVYYSLMVLTNRPIENVFPPTYFNIIPYFDALIVSLLWTFGLIIMLNQRLNAGMSEANEDLQLIFNTSPDAAIITRLEDGRIIDVNEGYISITGYSREEMAGKSSLDINIWKNIADRQEIVGILQEKGFCNNFETRFRKKDGTEIIGLMSAKIISLQDVSHIISITRDISGRIQIEEALRSSEEKYRLISDNTDDWIYWIAPDGNLVYISPSCEKVTGYSPEEFINQPELLEEIYFQEDRELFGSHTGKVHEKKHSDFLDIRIHAKSGELRWISHSCGPVFNAKGEYAGSRVTNRDITDRKMAELLFKKEKDWTEMIIQSAPNLIVGLGENSKIILFNKFAEELTGYQANEVLAKDWIQVFIPQEEREQLYGMWHEIRNNNLFARQHENEIVLKSGEKRTIRWNNSVLTENGKFRMVLSIGEDITERKKAEEELILHHTLLKSLINSVQDTIIFSLDKNYCYTAFNEAHHQEMKKIWNADIVIGTSLLECMQIQALRELAKQSIDRSLNGEAFSEIQYQPEQDIYYEFSWNPIRNASEIIGITVLIRDITNNKKAEKERQLFSNVLEQSLDEIYIFEVLSLRFVTVNKGAIINIGYSIEELRSMTPLDLKPDFTEVQFKELIRPLVEGEQQAVQFSTFQRRKDGSTYPVDVHLSINQQEKLFVAIILDVTTTKQKEEELRLSAEKFKNVFEHAAVGKSLTSLDGVVQVNNAFCSMIGYSIEELSAIKWQELTHPDDVGRDTEIIDSLLRGENEQARWVKRYLHKDGSIVWVDISSMLQRDIQGHPLYFITTLSDITSQIHTQEKLRETNDEIKHLNETLEQRVVQRTAQLEASNQELEAFTYSVSHDLRAPLRHISGYVDLLAQRCQSSLTEQGIHYLDTIAGSVNQMGTLIDDLLQFSRTGRQEMRETAVDMNNLLQEVMEMMKDEYSGRSIEWVVARLPGVVADHALLRLVWVNLLSNAIKFTRPKKSARIEIGFHRDKKEFVFFVRDNGAGFDMQYAHKLFGVFQRLHSAKEFEGTGIGLANVRRIILRHGGRTWAEARPDKGATFFFTLPEVEEAETKK